MPSISNDRAANSRSLVPFPSCCTDPRYLCPRCSLAAVEAGAVTNSQPVLNRRVDRKAVLPIPTINWKEIAAEQRNQQVSNVDHCSCQKANQQQTANSGNHGLLIPKPDWKEWSGS